MEIDPNGAAQTGSEPADAPDGEAMGRMIREARKAKGMTLEDTARAAGIGRSTLYRKVREYGLEDESKKEAS